MYLCDTIVGSMTATPKQEKPTAPLMPAVQPATLLPAVQPHLLNYEPHNEGMAHSESS